jgi:hypothetical protein
MTAGAILAIATVLIAWAGFQNTQWVRERFLLSDTSSAAAVEAGELRVSADLDEQWDRSVFAGLARATLEGDAIGVEAHEVMVRDGVRPLVEAWLRSHERDPLATLERDPFMSDVYDVEQRRNRAAKARETANSASAASRDASQNGANYALLMVFFAGALTFVGLTPLFHDPRVRWLMLGLATVAVLGGIALLAGLPVLL